MLKEFKDMIEKYNKYKVCSDMEIRVSYIINMFEECVYTEVELFEDGNELDKYTKIIDFESNAKCHNYANKLTESFQKKGINAYYRKEIFR